ncbi:hypothetical protein EMCG_01054 [[Emmonsia] crescens]|uniref:Uncharacterized protein n=1 Tax=[Emmonsia] crescens TaxID=73230 RepID=A0A0G2ICI6_9EURO|nr:hypothetical protein EMCG_01054 [Emmonsia crescens UAMH 3008]
MQVYYIRDLTPVAERCLREMYKAHIFRFKEDIFIASEKKPNVPGVQDMSLEYSCDDESFLYAAAAGQKASSAFEMAYMNIIKSRGLEKTFEEVCASRDGEIKEYLEALSDAWLLLLKRFDHVHWCLLRLLKTITLPDTTKLEEGLAYWKNVMVGAMIDALEEIRQIPEHSTDILYTIHTNSLLGCYGRMATISWSFHKTKETKSRCDLLSIADLLMEIKEEFRHDLVKIHTMLNGGTYGPRDIEPKKGDNCIPLMHDVMTCWYSAEAEKVKHSDRIYYVGETRLEDGEAVRSVLYVTKTYLLTEMLPDNVKLRLQNQEQRQLREQQKEQRGKRLRTLRSYLAKTP